jgi:hypothetical protein
MSALEDPEGREHVGDEYITYNRHQERRHRLYFLPFSPSSEEEEEAHREAERRAEREAKREAERMLGDIYEQPEGRQGPHKSRGSFHVDYQWYVS